MRCTRRSAALLAGRNTMITTTRLAVIVPPIALAACGVTSGMGGDDDGGGGGGGGGDDQPPTKPLDPTGTYTLHSTFDLATNMPGTAGAVVNTIIAATDDVDDPSLWIIDQILAKLPDGTAKDLLEAAEAIGIGALNEQVKKLTPDFFSTMIQVGRTS